MCDEQTVQLDRFPGGDGVSLDLCTKEGTTHDVGIAANTRDDVNVGAHEKNNKWTLLGQDIL